MSYNNSPPGHRQRPQETSSRSAFSQNQGMQRVWSTTEDADLEAFAPSHGSNNYEEGYGRDPLSSYPPPPHDRWSQEEESEFPTFPDSSRVEHVHHASPIGPAVSVFPRGTSYSRQSRQPSQSAYQYPHHHELHNYRTVPRPCHYEAPEFTSRHYSPTTVIDHEIESFIRVKSDPDRKMVEISPAFRVPLRGAAETEKAIQQGLYLTCACLSCTLEIYCIIDASYILCPLCRVVSPVSTEDEFPKSAYGVQGEGGLGLGVTPEIFEDILHKYRSTRGFRM